MALTKWEAMFAPDGVTETRHQEHSTLYPERF